MKIAYFVGSLATQGGTNRMVTEKANYFATHLGYDVTIITCYQHEDQQNTYLLSDAVKQIKLTVPFASQYQYGYPKRLWVKWANYRKLHQELNKTVQQVDPDILIGIAQFKADLVSKIKCRGKIVIECHEARNYSLSGLGMKRSFFPRVYMSIYRYKYFRTIERHADVVCPLTEGDAALWKRARRVEVIPNFSTMPISQFSDSTAKRVIAVGRLEWEKGYSRLIQVWKIVSGRHPDWQLDIFGEGEMEHALRLLIDSNGVKNINIHHFTHDISQEYAHSSICVLTSFFEGFSLVLLEAQRHGVPCIAFDCPFGPKSIINDSYSGFLVNDSDIRVFAERVCRLIEDKDLREHFSQVGIEQAKIFDVNTVINQWKYLFESLTRQN